MSPVCAKVPAAKFGKTTRKHHYRCCSKSCKIMGDQKQGSRWIGKVTRKVHEPDGQLKKVKACKCCCKQVPDEMKQRQELNNLKLNVGEMQN